MHKKQSIKMNKAKERLRIESDISDYPKILPQKRRVLTYTDYDSGEPVTHVFECYKSKRVDCFKVIVDGKLWKECIGWSKILEGLRKASPRVLSEFGC